MLETRDRWGTAFGNGRALSAPRIREPIHGSTLACFERFDLNGSGRLDYRELTRALRQLGLDLSRAEAAEVLAEYDADGSGLMEVDEFARLVHRLGHGAAGDSPHDSWDGFGRHDSRAYGRDSSRDARLVYGGEHSAAYYYLPPEPYLPPARERELTGELRVRVSSSAGRWIASHHSDQPAGGAYVVLELAGHRAQSVLLPPCTSASPTPSGEGNLFRLPVPPRLAASAAGLRLDTIAWWPGTGEHSLGATAVPLQEVIALGRLELHTPLDALVELVWQASDGSAGGWATHHQAYYGDDEQPMAAGGAGWA